MPPEILANQLIVEDIIEPKLNGNALAGLYRKYTGRRVIVSSAAAQAEFSFVQEASASDPLSYAKAAELLRKAATIENFVFVPDEQDPELDILTIATGGIRPTGRGVDVYNENDELPEGDAVISYVMQLDYIKPAEAVNTFTQIIGQFGAFGSIAAVPNAAAVVITENTSLIRKLIQLKEEIDKPGSVQATRFIPVRYADVTEIANILNDLLNAQQQAQTTAGVQRADAPAPAANAAPVANAGGAATASSAGEATPVQIVAEPRTNRIFAMGRPVDLIFVEGLVREFDIPTDEKTFFRRKLRFLTVSEFLPIAGDALNRAFSGSGEGGTSGGSSGGRSTATGTNRATQTSSANSGNSRFGNNNNSSFGGSSSFGGGSRSSTSLGDPNISSAPESLLVGRTLLVADNITNSIVAQGPPSALEIIQRLLDQIDIKPEQVMISTVIGQLSLIENKQFGLGYLLDSGDIRAGGGGGLDVFAPDSTANTFPELDLRSIASSGLRLYGTTGDLSTFVKAIQNKSDFTVLSRPSIFTSNNQKGVISSGERIAVPTEGGTSTGVSSSGTRIQYQDVVLKLEVIPLVNSDNEITMQIALLNDEQNGEQTIEGAGTNGGDLTVPRITTREILTTATVPNGNTIVLGGLIINRGGSSKSGIPILGDIPYLGRLFSTKSNDSDRSELMVFIQPSIVSNTDSIDALQADMDARYQVADDARFFTAPEETPPPAAIPVIDPNAKPAKKPKASSSSRPSIRPTHRR